jgi:hypothetical protein
MGGSGRRPGRGPEGEELLEGAQLHGNARTLLQSTDFSKQGATSSCQQRHNNAPPQCRGRALADALRHFAAAAPETGHAPWHFAAASPETGHALWHFAAAAPEPLP